MVNKYRIRTTILALIFAFSNVTPAQAISVKAHKNYAKDYMFQKYGWGEKQFSCLSNLWQRESGWNPKAHNKSSGAYGIPQALPGSKMGKGWKTDAKVQVRWGLKYIKGRYSTPCGAWSAFKKKGWY